MVKIKTAKTHLSETSMWVLTILSLAIACSALALLIDENQDLRADNARLVSALE